MSLNQITKLIFLKVEYVYLFVLFGNKQLFKFWALNFFQYVVSFCDYGV